MEENSIWRIIISLKYGMEDGSWFSNTPRGSYRVGPWKDITKKQCHCCKIARLRLAMGTKSGFERMFGVERPLYVLLSPPFMKWLVLKGQKWQSFGKSQGWEEGGTSDLKDTLMIERWRRFRDSSVSLVPKA